MPRPLVNLVNVTVATQLATTEASNQTGDHL